MVLKNDGLYNGFDGNSDIPDKNNTPMDEEDVIMMRSFFRTLVCSVHGTQFVYFFVHTLICSYLVA